MNKKKKLYKIEYIIEQESTYSLRHEYKFNMIIPAKDEVQAIQIFYNKMEGRHLLYKITYFAEYKLGDQIGEQK
jgi:hypothetical protein